MNELGNTPADKNYKPSGISKASPGRNWMEWVVNQPLNEFTNKKEELIKEAFLEHFGFELSDVKDKENLEHLVFNEQPISSFRYRGETFLYWQDNPDYKVEGDMISFTSLYLKV